MTLQVFRHHVHLPAQPRAYEAFDIELVVARCAVSGKVKVHPSMESLQAHKFDCAKWLRKCWGHFDSREEAFDELRKWSAEISQPFEMKTFPIVSLDRPVVSG